MALARRINRGVVKRDWRIICMVFAQLLLLALVAFQAWRILGIHVDFYLKQVFFKPNPSTYNLAVLGIALIAFALLYFLVKKRSPLLFAAEKSAPGIIKETARAKLHNAKEDPRVSALLLIDFMFVATVVIALAAYFDPETELIPWSKVGVGPPFTTIINAAIALAVLGLFYYMYRYTATYRKRR